MANEIITCANCKSKLETSRTCPKCGLVNLPKKVLEFASLATGDTKSVLADYENERGNDNKAKIKKFLDEAESWRYNKDYTVEYVKEFVDVVRFTDIGDLEIRNVAKMGTATKTRMANEERVFENIKSAARLGSFAALVQYGKCLLGGYGCKRQTINAIAVLSRTVKDGESYRLLVQGDEFYGEDFGVRIPSDIMSRSSFDDYWTNNLTNVRFWAKRENPLEELSKFAEADMLWAKYVIGEIYVRGLTKVNTDYFDKGVALILEAADSGPYNVQRALKAKALLQFDKLIDLKGQNNVDAALQTIWRIENILVRREAEMEILMRTSLVEHNGKSLDFKFDSRGAQLVWRAIKNFKEANKVEWITLPDSREKCEELSEGMFGDNYSYRGAGNKVKKDDGKVAFYRAPFIGKHGFLGTTGLCFDCRTGLYGNLKADKFPNYKFEYGQKYNYRLKDGFEYPANEDVDVLWLFREPEGLQDVKSGRKYLDWGLGPVDFKPAGFTGADLVALIDYVRRYVFSDLKKGVKKFDGSVQKAQFASKTQIPMCPSKHTEYLIQMLGEKSGVVGSFSASPQKRWKFVLMGLFFGLFGLHFLYVRRKGWFTFYWLCVGAQVAQSMVPFVKDMVANISPTIAQLPVFGLLAILILVSSVLFMRKDGAGNRM